MKEILFRGKVINTNDWVEGSLAYSPSEKQNYIIEHCDEELSFAIENETVGQYTGLTDKNGNKIFEGDVVKNKSENHALIGWDVTDGYTSMLFIGRTCNSLYRLDKYQSQCVTIIGNIHDNPKLLEES